MTTVSRKHKPRYGPPGEAFGGNWGEVAARKGPLVLHYFSRCVPNPKLLSQFRIERFEERLVKILDSVLFLKLAKEHGPVDPIENGVCAI
jgi:hypothetical protein